LASIHPPPLWSPSLVLHKVKTKGIIKVNEHFIFKDVALVEHLKCKLLYVSLVLDDGLEISF
jgi:hypothetical protein